MKRKPYFIETVRSTNKQLSIDLLFDRDGQEFFAAIGAESVRHTDLNTARKLARDFIDGNPQYVWEPVIVVEQSEPEYDDENHFHGTDVGKAVRVGMDFVYWRCERSAHPSKAGEWFARPYSVDFEERLARLIVKMTGHQRKGFETRERGLRERNEALRTFSQADGRNRVLPYDEDLWAALGKIRETIAETRRRLAHLIGSKQFESKLRQFRVAAMPLMLPAAKR